MPSIIPCSKDCGNCDRKQCAVRVFAKFGCDFSISGGEATAEICPFCGGSKFSIKVDTGQYGCFNCRAGGNLITYLTWVHKQALAETAPALYLELKAKRGISSQMLRKHELAYHQGLGCWLLPFKNREGNVVNLQLYYPNKNKPNKFNLPGLPMSLYGLDRLSDEDKITYLCEGLFDAIALEYQISDKHRSKYDIVATPGAFQERWAPLFKGRKVIALYDNDAAGQSHREGVRKFLGESRIAKSLKLLHWPPGYEGYDINDLIRKETELNIPGWIEQHASLVKGEKTLKIRHGRSTYADRVREWLWPDHVMVGTYVSFSGKRGSMKSTVVLYMSVCYSNGTPMPLQERAGLPAGHVLYVHAE